jgi:hypothetical protein
VKIGQKWWKIGHNWSKMAKMGRKWLKNRLKMVKNGKKIGRNRSEMVKNGS